MKINTLQPKYTIILLLFINNFLLAQVGINSDNSAPSSNAMLDVKSTIKGVLIPRVGADLASPSEGLLYYNTTGHNFRFYDGAAWQNTFFGNQWNINGTAISYSLGNVGIGTTTPSRAKLEVHGAVDATSAIFGGESSGISIQRNWPGIGYNTYLNNGNRYLINGFAAKQYLDPTSGNMYVDMYSNGVAGGLPPVSARALTLSPTGNVGIKGASTNAELQLPNTISNRKLVLWESANNDHQYFGLGVESGTLRYSVAGTGNVHRFYAGVSAGSSQLLMSIWGNKNLIIGTQNGGSKVGINSINPLYPLEIVQTGGRGLAIIDPNTYNYFGLNTNLFGSTNNLYIVYNEVGVAFIDSDGNYHSGSDERLKENIQPMHETLSKLMELKPKTYAMKYNNPDKKTSLGLIGQQLYHYFPELVSITDGASFGHKELKEIYTINYSGLSVIAIKAIQEQQQQIIDLQKRMQLLENQNKMLMELINLKKKNS